jgi:hypothetical protein
VQLGYCGAPLRMSRPIRTAPARVRIMSWWTLPNDNDPAEVDVFGDCFSNIIGPLGGTYLFIRKNVTGSGDGNGHPALLRQQPAHRQNP